MAIGDKIIHQTVSRLSEGTKGRRDDIEKGVRQVASFWKEEDGTEKQFQEFCLEQYIHDDLKRDEYFLRLEGHFEVIFGSLNKINVAIKRPLHLDWGELLPVDMSFAKFNPFAHLTEDLFLTKIAFFVLLNFPSWPLGEKLIRGEKWDRNEWSRARMGDLFISRVPTEVNQKISDVMTVADTYIAQYNIFMGNLLDSEGNRPFPQQLKLISHWGLRDEIKGRYRDPQGLNRQKMIYQVMNRIIAQEIPTEMINQDQFDWDPFENKLYDKNKNFLTFSPEPDTRYEHLLKVSKVIRLQDEYYPLHPTHMKRKFEVDREIPEVEVETLFKELMASKPIRTIGKLIQKRLGRPLEPFDIWYDGFKMDDDTGEEELNRRVAEKFPNVEGFQEKIDDILMTLGFSQELAEFIQSKVSVEPARGAGHAWGAEMRSEKSYLRTRVPEKGMDYKGFNTAMHELGHCVEQTLSLYHMDRYMLHGIPNTAFTETFAFIFQSKDLQFLTGKKSDEQSWRNDIFHLLWSSYEIMGVALVDMGVWNWMYKNPEATPKQLKEAVIQIAKDIWNQFYSDVFGVKDQFILAIYSHMIDTALYLPDYPLGYLIKFQIESYMKDKSFAEEVERMCTIGCLTPKAWMQNAVGDQLSVKPLLVEAESLLKQIKEG